MKTQRRKLSVHINGGAWKATTGRRPSWLTYCRRLGHLAQILWTNGRNFGQSEGASPHTGSGLMVCTRPKTTSPLPKVRGLESTVSVARIYLILTLTCTPSLRVLCLLTFSYICCCPGSSIFPMLGAKRYSFGRRKCVAFWAFCSHRCP